MIGGNLGAAVQMLKVINQQGGGGQSWDTNSNYISAISVLTTSNTEQTITATIVGTGQDGVSFEFSVDSGATWTVKGTAANGILLATGLTPNTSYSWRARLYKATNYGSYSNVYVAETTTYESYISGDADLIAFYRMDEQAGATFKDTTGNNDAAINGTVTLGVENTFVKEPTASDAATFDGASGYAVIGDKAALDFARDDPFTFNFIVKPNVVRSGASVDYWVYTKANTVTPYQGLLIGLKWNTLESPNHTRIYVMFIATYPTQALGFKCRTYDFINDETNMITVTYDGSAVVAGLKVYLNAVSLSNNVEAAIGFSQTIEAGQDTVADGINAEIGRRTSLNSWFKGDLKDLAIFNSCKTEAWIRKLNVLAKCYDPIYTVKPIPKIFYDLDIDSDIDDVVEVLMNLNLEQRGEIDIIAAVVTATGVKAAACLYAILNYYGRTDLPVGVNTEAVGYESDLYNSAVVTAYGVVGKLTAADFENYLVTQRRELALQPDASVEYITTGDLSSVKGLIDSVADEFSALNGVDLIKAKIKHLWVVAGNWPRGSGVSDFGGTAPRAVVSDYVLDNWPSEVPIIFVPINEGDGVETGENVMMALNDNNPAKLAWTSYFGNNLVTNKRPGWAQIATLSIARGLYNQQTTSTKYAGIVGHKATGSVDTTSGVTAWNPSVNGGHNYLWKIETDANIVTKVNELIKDVTEW